MANTNVLLREDVEDLGGRGDIVKVRAGYARNYLIPQGLATLATKGNVKQVEQERAALLRKAAVEKSTAEGQADQMRDVRLEFERKAGERGALFGSVTSMDIAEGLRAKGYEIDRRKIVLKEPIKQTGKHTVNVRLHREVTLPVPVTVRAEGAPAEDETAAEENEQQPAADGDATAGAADGAEA